MSNEGEPKIHVPLYFLTPEDGNQVGVLGIKDGELIIEQTHETGGREGKKELAKHFSTEIQGIDVDDIPFIPVLEMPQEARLIDKERVHPKLVFGRPFISLQEDGEEPEDSLLIPAKELLDALRNPYHTQQFGAETQYDNLVTCVVEKGNSGISLLLVFGTSGDSRIEGSAIYYKEFVIDLAEAFGYQRYEVERMEDDDILDCIQAKVAEISPKIKKEYGVEPSPFTFPEGSYSSPRTAPDLLVCKARTGLLKQQIIIQCDGDGFFVIGRIPDKKDYFERIDGITGGNIVGVDGNGDAMYLGVGAPLFMRPARVGYKADYGGLVESIFEPDFINARTILYIDGSHLLIDAGNRLQVVQRKIGGSLYRHIQDLDIYSPAIPLSTGRFVRKLRSWRERETEIYKIGNIRDDIVVERINEMSSILEQADAVRSIGISAEGDHILLVDEMRVVIFRSGDYKDDSILLENLPFGEDVAAEGVADPVLCAFDRQTGHVIVAISKQMNPADTIVKVGYVGNVRQDDEIRWVNIDMQELLLDEFPRDNHLSIAGMYPYHDDSNNGFIIVFENGQSCLVRVPRRNINTSVKGITS